MSNPDQNQMKQECANQRECMEMLQLIVDGEASPEQKEHFLSITSKNACLATKIITWK